MEYNNIFTINYYSHYFLQIITLEFLRFKIYFDRIRAAYNF